MRLVQWTTTAASLLTLITGCGAPLAGADNVDEAIVPAPAGTNPAAARAAAANDPACTAVAPFYWDIGDGLGSIASGSIGTRYDGETAINIASASKLLFGAYVVERFQNNLSLADFQSMTMRSGYTNLTYDSCVLASTVDDCLSKANNGVQDPTLVGVFNYNGGHFQHYAHVLDLGGDNSAALTKLYNDTFGLDLDLYFSSPQLAAGLRATPNAYARFLRKVLNGRLQIKNHLGENPVCTDKDACPGQAQYSPAYPLAWGYSWGHWIESDQSDGAFSSPGAFGFYPWIDHTKTFYGIVARYEVAESAATDSARCGEAIRKAFLNE